MRVLLSLIALWLSVVCATAQTQLFSGAPISTPPITKNIVSDYGATCNGDFRAVSRSITYSSNLLQTLAADTFTAGDVGRQIYIPSTSSGGATTSAIITVFNTARSVNVSLNAFIPASGLTVTLSIGSDDAPAFGLFNAFGIAQGNVPLQLNIPSGTCQFLTAGNVTGGVGTHFVDGVRNLTVVGAGRTATSLSSPYAPAFFFLGQFAQQCQKGIVEATGCSARIETVSAGSTQVQLTAASLASGYISRFAVGRLIMVSGVDTQAFGAPTNPFYFEWVRVSAINTMTGVIDLEAPLANEYKSTWPLYFAGSSSKPDYGGPATIYNFPTAWDSTAVFKDLTIDQPFVQSYAWGRYVTFNNVLMASGGCIVPTQNETYTATNSDYTACGVFEVDKLVGQVTFTGTSINVLKFQSGGAVKRLDFSNGSINQVDGLPYRAFFTNVIIGSFTSGAGCCGRTQEVVCTSCAITTVNSSGGATTVGLGGMSNIATMSGGTITWPRTINGGLPPPIAVPGSNILWVGGGLPADTLAQVTDITADATNIYIQTNLPGGLSGPNGFPSVGATVDARIHPAPQFTCVSCTGDAQAVDFNGAPVGAPMFSYSSRVYDGTTNTPTGPTIWGRLTSLTVNTTKAYTGSQGTMSFRPTRNDVYTTFKSDYSTVSYIPIVNIKNPGGTPHTLVVSCASQFSCSSSGNQTGDSVFTVTEGIWWPFALSPRYSAAMAVECNATPSVCPSITVTVQTDQGVVNPFMMEDADWSWLIGDNDNANWRQAM